MAGYTREESALGENPDANYLTRGLFCAIGH